MKPAQNNFVEENFGQWGQSLFAHTKFEAEIQRSLQQILMDMTPALQAAGLEVSEFEPHHKMDARRAYYGAMCRISKFPGLTIPEDELVELFSGINYARKPGDENQFMPYAFIEISWDSAQRPGVYKEALAGMEYGLEQAGHAMNIGAGGCYICFESSERVLSEWSKVSAGLEKLITGVARTASETGLNLSQLAKMRA